MAKYAITGSTGFVGTALCQHLAARGDTVLRLVRGGDDPGTARWDPATPALDQGRLAGTEVVVHLAGESIAGGLWTRGRRARIRDSRVVGTTNLSRALAALPQRPRTLVAASAIGFYGSRGDELLDEHSAMGTGFLAEVARAWEAATAPAAAAGIHVVNLRIGIVVGRGGVVGKMLLPFRLWLGGPFGDGRQYVSWIALPDLVAAIAFAANDPGLAGPVNAVSPTPVTNREFSRALGKALRRPSWLPFPAFAAKLLPGRMAQETFLASQRVVPQRLLDAGFEFTCKTPAAAFAATLGT